VEGVSESEGEIEAERREIETQKHRDTTHKYMYMYMYMYIYVQLRFAHREARVLHHICQDLLSSQSLRNCPRVFHSAILMHKALILLRRTGLNSKHFHVFDLCAVDCKLVCRFQHDENSAHKVSRGVVFESGLQCGSESVWVGS